MVNILKHRKINKNPFVKYLKNFNKNDLETKTEPSATEGKLEYCLGNGRSISCLDNERTVIADEGSLYLINKEYYPLGCFKIPIEELDYTSGNIYFITNTTDSSFKQDFQIFFSSKKELYKLIAEFDSIRNGTTFKELLFVMQEVGLFKQKVNLG